MIYNKYRPRNMDEVRGQEYVKRVLSRQVESGQIPNAYLFVGPAGTGKTTCARILSSMLNCSTGVSMKPDPNDRFVSDILTGRCQQDVYEIDAASYGRVENARKLREEAFMAPLVMARKIYIIDECHRLSPEAWEALLKIMEEPPKSVLFILCTTDPSKIKQTILTRAMVLEFKPLLAQEVMAELRRVSSAEKITIDDDALRMLSIAAKGSMRQALNWLETCLQGSSGERITADKLSGQIGLVNRSRARDFINSVINKKFVDSMTASSSSLAEGCPPSEFLSECANYCHDMMLVSAAGFSMENMGYTSTEIEDVRRSKDDIVKLCNGGVAIDVILLWISALQESSSLTVFNMNPQFMADTAFVKMHSILRTHVTKSAKQG